MSLDNNLRVSSNFCIRFARRVSARFAGTRARFRRRESSGSRYSGQTILSQDGFQLREAHFNRVQVGAVGRQRHQRRTFRFDEFFGDATFVGRQMIPNNNVARLQRRTQNVTHVCLQTQRVHRAVQHLHRRHARPSQRTNQRRIHPMSMRNTVDQSNAAQRPTLQTRHVAFRAALQRTSCNPTMLRR